MSGNFLVDKPYFSKPQRAGNPALYVFEAFLLVLLFSAWLGLQDLNEINGGRSTAESPANAFAMIGCLGLYGIRISSWIAIVRRNRMPQTLEWMATIVAFALMILCFVFSGPLVRAYAAGHGYRFCGRYQERETMLTFARPGVGCPAASKPSGS